MSLLQGGSNDKIFSEKFFDTIEKRRSDLAKSQQTLVLLQAPVFAYLILVLVGVDINLSILGITAGKNLREVLVVASAGLGLWGTWLSNEKEAISSMLKARNDRLAKGDKEKMEFLDAGYGVSPLVWVFPVGHRSPTWFHLVSFFVWVIALIVLAIFALGFGIVVHVMTLVEVYNHPNFPAFPTKVVIGFVAMADLITVSWILATSGVFPYRDATRLMRFDRIRNVNPKRYNAILRGAIEEHRRKGPLRRLLTRPKLPNDL